MTDQIWVRPVCLGGFHSWSGDGTCLFSPQESVTAGRGDDSWWNIKITIVQIFFYRIFFHITTLSKARNIRVTDSNLNNGQWLHLLNDWGMLRCSTLTRSDGSLERLIQNRVYVLQVTKYIAQVSVKNILWLCKSITFHFLTPISTQAMTYNQN